MAKRSNKPRRRQKAVAQEKNVSSAETEAEPKRTRKGVNFNVWIDDPAFIDAWNRYRDMEPAPTKTSFIEAAAKELLRKLGLMSRKPQSQESE